MQYDYITKSAQEIQLRAIITRSSMLEKCIDSRGTQNKLGTSMF